MRFVKPKPGFAALLLAGLLGLSSVSSAEAAFGIDYAGASLETPAGGLSRQAGEHADLNVRLEFPRTPEGKVDGNLRDVKVDLPAGLLGNPRAAASCDFGDLVPGGPFPVCPVASQIGFARITSDPLIGPDDPADLQQPVYNMRRPADAPALFAFNFGGVAVTFSPRVRAADYGISSDSLAITQAQSPFYVDVTFWGVPADPAHDFERTETKPPYARGIPSPDTPKAFLSNPTSCPETPLAFNVFADTWSDPDVWIAKSFDADREGTPFLISGCSQVPFDPAASATPASRTAAAPSGFDVELTVPQSDSPTGLASAHVKRTVVRFPEGVSVSPGSAAGQGACTEAQIDLGTHAPPTCPDSARIATVEIATPLLDETLHGSLYLAEPHRNPFGSLLATYLAVEGPGFYLKLAGALAADPATGRLTATFDDQPQLPYESVKVALRSGAGAPLTLPGRCGTYATEIEMTSWASPAPVALTSPFTLDRGCDTGGFDPGLRAGTTDPRAGRYSPFLLALTRADGEQNPSRIAATLPAGLLAKLAGVPLCPEAAAPSGACPPASQIGRTTVALGAGPTPLLVPEAGKEPTAVYLAGPYKGAPYSLVVRVPAQAGPFDLGTVAVRSAIDVDPVTAQVTFASDPLPQILEGIPLAYREIGVQVDRPEFTLNPTSCSSKRIAARVTSAQGALATPAPRFAVAGCGDLAFRPQLRLRLKGRVSRRAHPSLRATLFARPGVDANIGRAQVKLPKAAFLDNDHIDGICTRVQFAADQCPAGSIYGKALARTPLLDFPVAGPVYLRANPAHKLPDLIAALRGPGGEPIEVELAGKTDSVKGALRNTFEAVPDVPVTKFHLELFGGKRGLIEMSSGFCRSPRATLRFTGHNGAEYDTRPKVAAKCPKQKKHGKDAGARRR